jgi:hypothetical protein
MSIVGEKQRRYWGLAIAAVVCVAISLALYFDGVSYGGWRQEWSLYLYLLHIDRSGGVLEDAVVDYWIEREFNLVASGVFFAMALLLTGLRMDLMHRRRGLRQQRSGGCRSGRQSEYEPGAIDGKGEE